MSFPTFVTLNAGYSSLVLYNSNTKIFYPLPTFKSFEDIARSQITSFNISEDFKDSFGNVVGAFLDQNGNQWHSVVQYNKIKNQINPPISFIIPPSVTCLKGNIHQYGSSLENVSTNIVYIGRNFNMGGWRLPKSKWHNPFTVKDYGRDEALRRYREYVINTPQLLNSIYELNGKILACWCQSNEPCHGNILIELYLNQVK